MRLAALLLLLLFISTVMGQEAKPYFTEPSLSPDRKEIAFVSGGDIWTVPATGGVASLLVSHSANEGRPLYSPDGKQLAFISNRTGGGDIYILTFASGELRRLTFDDGLDLLDGWSRDGRWIYFSSTAKDIGGVNDVYRVSSAGGTPMAISADRYANEFFSAPSPDGSTLAITARGISSSQWWRNGHSHLDESEIWLLKGTDAGPGSYERVTQPGGAKEMWPMWSGDGKTLFYVSDRVDTGNKNGAQNIWTTIPGRNGFRRVSEFTEGRVLWPSISYDGKEIVFEHNFSIWKLDTQTGKSVAVDIQRRGAPAGPAVEHLRITDSIAEMQLSPDGKKVAFVTRGEVFAASAADGGDAARVSRSAAEEYQINWSPDSRKLVYASDRDGVPHLFLYDFTNNTETQLTRAATDDSSPRFSPDGKLIAFIRDAKDLCVVDPTSKQERTVASGYLERPPIMSERPFVWSPDSKWIAFAPVGDKAFKNVSVVSVDGGPARPISFLANVFSNTISWSPDGTFILFDSGQRTESTQLARIDLIPRTPRFREDQFRDLFREETPRNVTPGTRPEPRPSPTDSPRELPSPGPATTLAERPGPKATQVVFDDIRRRLSLLPVGVDVNYQTISPDGKWVAMTANSANQTNLYIYSLDELAREPAVARQLTSTPGFKTQVQFTPDNKELFYLENGRIGIVNQEGRTRSLAVAAEMDVDFAKEKMEVFRQGWTYLRDNFYDPGFHGANWEKVRSEYEPLIAGSRTPDEMRRLMQLMVGELNASHLGVSGPGGSGQATTGKLGLRFDRNEYENNGRLKVTEVIALSPAAIQGIKVGEYLVSVDGQSIDARINLDELLSFKVNRRVSLQVASSADGTGRREVVVRPANANTERGLIYRQWVEKNREYVAKISNGRLGYVHMFDMGAGSLAQLYVDLDAENHARDGVVVDVRNNNGGFVNVYAIDVLARRGYLSMSLRGAGTASARTVLGQRALERPTILVTNQHSLSDAEDFTEGYRSLKLGSVVGEPTAGWIIYTWNQSLLDGSTLRLPRMKVTANDGTVMERNPRPVDFEVSRPIGESLTGKDSQLDVAVRELLKQLGTARTTSPR